MSDTLLGQGLASGMFFHAPKGTALPKYPLEKLETAWKSVGDVTSDGISLKLSRSSEDLKTWANKVKRSIMKDHSETIDAPIMDTTEESMKTVFGSDKVTVTPADSTHGKLIDVNISASELPDEEAYLFLMKDGDDSIAIGCTDGQITDVASVKFKTGEAINWTPTIKGLGDGWSVIIDYGAVTKA